MLPQLALQSLWNRRLTTLLTVASIALSVALFLGIEQIRASARDSFSGTISQTDLIAGPRAGNVSLLLYTVFRIGAPLNNLRYETYERFAQHPAVAWTIPLAFGDSHRGFRVVGTSESFYQHYRYRRDRSIRFASGRAPKEPLDVALGADVARQLNYGLGAKIVLTHGVGGGMLDHDDKPFIVCGILERTATPIDRSLYITFAGVEAMHEGWEGEEHDDHEGHDDHKGHDDHEGHEHEAEQVSAFLLRAKSRVDTLRLQREIATFEGEPMSAVIPGVALAELWSTVRYAEDALRIVSGAVLGVSLLALLIALYTTLNERRREMAILRALGLSKIHVLGLLVFESFLLAAAGCVLGAGLVYLLQAGLEPWIEQQFGLYVRMRGLTGLSISYLAAVLAASAGVGLIPAWRAYRNSVADGLTIHL